MHAVCDLLCTFPSLSRTVLLFLGELPSLLAKVAFLNLLDKSGLQVVQSLPTRAQGRGKRCEFGRLCPLVAHQLGGVCLELCCGSSLRDQVPVCIVDMRDWLACLLHNIHHVEWHQGSREPQVVVSACESAKEADSEAGTSH